MSEPNKADIIHCRKHVGGYNPISGRKNRRLTDILRSRRLRIGGPKQAGSISDSLNFNSEASNLSAIRSSSHSGVSRNHSINSYQSAKSVKSNGTALTNLSSSYTGGGGSTYSKSSSSSKGKNFRHSKYEDEISEGQLGINEKELNSMNKHIPALKSYGKSATFRQHYYPEGGWGWVIAFCSFLVELFTTGLQLSFSSLYLEIIRYTGKEYAISSTWLGSTNFSLSCFLAPFLIALCRRKSTRLISIIGGLVISLSILFTSFAEEFHQIFLSYGLMCAIGVSMVRETATLMLSQYFKRRRELVEMLSGSGVGFGIAIFSNVYSSGISSYGWRFGLQLISITLISLFFLGLFYRSASLYHPQRRAILHLKDMSKRKGKDKNKMESKPPYFDFASLKIRTFRIILLSTVFTSLGVYTPLFYFAPMAQEEGIKEDIMLLQTFIGLGVSLGTFGFGFVVLSKSNQCLISRQYLVQASVFGVATSIFALISVEGYHGYMLFTWIYGVFLGGYLYTLKVYIYERLRVKHFNRGWGFLRGVQSLPILAGIPISIYTNVGEGNPKSGFYFSLATSLLGGIILFCAGEGNGPRPELFYASSKQELTKTDTNLTLELLPNQRRSREYLRSASGGIAGFTSSEMHSSSSSGQAPGAPEDEDIRQSTSRELPVRCTCGSSQDEAVDPQQPPESESDDDDEEEDDLVLPVVEDEEDVLVEKDDDVPSFEDPDSIHELEELQVVKKQLGKRKLTCISEENINDHDSELEVECRSKNLVRCSSEPEFTSIETNKTPFERRKTWYRH